MMIKSGASLVGAISGLVAAAPGWRVDAYAPTDTNISIVPIPSHVVAWALIADETEPGGSIVQPVFLAAGRTWTLDQFHAEYGASLELKVVPV